MPKIKEYKLNQTEKKFLKDQNINEIVIPPRHDILFYFHLIANKNEVMNAIRNNPAAFRGAGIRNFKTADGKGIMDLPPEI